MLNSSGREKAIAVHNWDPAYPGERVNWYSEYIARHAPVSVNWLEQPTEGSGPGQVKLDVCGIGVGADGRDIGNDRVIGPVEDGSVCIWDLGEDSEDSTRRKGGITARSRSGLLFQQNSSTPSSSPHVPAFGGVDECVSIDRSRGRAYFAVKSRLNEIDLETLQLVHQEIYPYSISALSEASYPTPLTVGTTLSLHLHDPRYSQYSFGSKDTLSDRVDTFAGLPTPPQSSSDFHRLFSGDISPSAPFSQPAPLSILHSSLPSSNESSQIYVAGRFPSILNYDRRFFPQLRNTIHSGARLCSITSLPYFSSEPASERRIHSPGTTLVAGGEYNGKGSLELYGIPTSEMPDGSNSPSKENSTFQNRQTASRSKVLSVANHGTRLVFSDGDGMLKWVERDGSSLVRRWNINEYSENHAPNQHNLFNISTGSGDVVRKIVSTGGELDKDRLMVWTGERIGMLRFKEKLEWDGDVFEEKVEGFKEQMQRQQEKDYGDALKRALERQADGVRLFRGLGLGSSP